MRIKSELFKIYKGLSGQYIKSNTYKNYRLNFNVNNYNKNEDIIKGIWKHIEFIQLQQYKHIDIPKSKKRETDTYH